MAESTMTWHDYESFGWMYCNFWSRRNNFVSRQNFRTKVSVASVYKRQELAHVYIYTQFPVISSPFHSRVTMLYQFVITTVPHKAQRFSEHHLRPTTNFPSSGICICLLHQTPRPAALITPFSLSSNNRILRASLQSSALRLWLRDEIALYRFIMIEVLDSPARVTIILMSHRLKCWRRILTLELSLAISKVI